MNDFTKALMVELGEELVVEEMPQWHACDVHTPDGIHHFTLAYWEMTDLCIPDRIKWLAQYLREKLLT